MLRSKDNPISDAPIHGLRFPFDDCHCIELMGGGLICSRYKWGRSPAMLDEARRRKQLRQQLLSAAASAKAMNAPI